MSIWRFLTDLVQAEHDQSEQLKESRRENLCEARAIKEELKEIRQLAGDIRVAMPLIREIHDAVVPEPVATIQLLNETGETSMDITVGQTSTLSAVFLGASGNPTVPVGSPVLASTDTTNFTLDPALAVLTSTGAVGSTTDVTLAVDGVTSNAVSYTIVSGVPVNEPVASIQLTGTTPV